MSEDLDLLFSLPLPGRGHAAAAHPKRSEAVAFARRPGVFAMVVDCRTGEIAARLGAPKGRHFYGHGVFSRAGDRLFTTENAYEDGVGVIGVWAADEGYRRIGEFHSGGVGPHDILRLPGSDMLVVANGGIDTHPDTGREKLNLATMRSNISFLTEDGRVTAKWGLAEDQRLNSIRHLAVSADGTVAFGCQWQGDLSETPPLVGLCSQASPIELFETGSTAEIDLRGYVGGVAFSGDGRLIAATAPRGDGFALFDCRDRRLSGVRYGRDVCGVAVAVGSFAYTTGGGE
ncbi:MAG: DUF1513 domain-containing protein, partial [Pseudomonadota bacterium]